MSLNTGTSGNEERVKIEDGTMLVEKKNLFKRDGLSI